ncbi:pyruvate formate-lyase 1-activating enzyme [Gemelliphila asaccharolytica]|uniref:Pyruvate formate-lyase-activating enzyme n=2 Tax=Gemelliphila asaccharolytica TaxID=502393 RepID=A0ABR5TM85_9BACL|nr:pyruvate formate-lyase 1-activating enzyme [Gemella asaccharolytica]
MKVIILVKNYKKEYNKEKGGIVMLTDFLEEKSKASDEKEELTGLVHSFESFGNLDGPGIRFVIFFQGCLLRCKYCHNPDTWKLHNPDAKRYTVKELVKKIVRYRPYFESSDGGGVTVSGGESLLQLDFVIELFKELKSIGINTCVDSCGGFYVNTPTMNKKVLELISLTDLFLMDIKHIDDDVHIRLTKRTNKNILQFIRFLSDNGAKMWIRHVLVPKWTDFDDDLRRLRKYIDTLNGVERVEVLPYHDMAKYKYKELGIKYELEDIEPPTKDRIKNAIEILGARNDL